LLTDPAARRAHSTDEGNLVHQTPPVVPRPGSDRDVARMVRFCREHRIPVAARGQHHSTSGPGLTAAGLLVETSWLITIHSTGPEGADVDAGVPWGDTTPRRDGKLAGGLGEL
jgi:FAD/FMN-containing dehydrogenase